jgi:hypothetical protein
MAIPLSAGLKPPKLRSPGSVYFLNLFNLTPVCMLE